MEELSVIDGTPERIADALFSKGAVKRSSASSNPDGVPAPLVPPPGADASCEGAGRLFVCWLILPPAPLTPMSSGPCLTRGRLLFSDEP